MVWFYNYDDKTIQLVTYFPHQAAADDGTEAKYDDLNFDGPDNVTVTPWGTLVLAEDGAGAPRAQLDPGRPDVRDRPQHAQRLRVHRPDVLRRRQGPLRQHPDPGHHPGHHRAVGDYLG